MESGFSLSFENAKNILTALFVYFRSFQATFILNITVYFSGIWTRIIRVEGKHANRPTQSYLVVSFLLFWFPPTSF